MASIHKALLIMRCHCIHISFYIVNWLPPKGWRWRLGPGDVSVPGSSCVWNLMPLDFHRRRLCWGVGLLCCFAWGDLSCTSVSVVAAESRQVKRTEAKILLVHSVLPILPLLPPFSFLPASCICTIICIVFLPQPSNSPGQACHHRLYPWSPNPSPEGSLEHLASHRRSWKH